MLSIAGCGGPPAKDPAPRAHTPKDLSAVDASLVFTDCADAPRLKGAKAEDAIHRLVDSCTSVPGGDVRFVAIFQPSGRIELDAPKGSAKDATIPLCVVRHDLRHKLPIQRACRVEVRMREQRLAARGYTVGETVFIELNGCWAAKVAAVTDDGIRIRWGDGTEQALSREDAAARRCKP